MNKCLHKKQMKGRDDENVKNYSNWKTITLFGYFYDQKSLKNVCFTTT